METLYSTILASPVGPLFLAASEKGLVALEFDARLPGQQTIRPNPRDLRSESAYRALRELRRQDVLLYHRIRRILRRNSTPILLSSRSSRNSVSVEMLAGAAGNSLRRNTHLRRYCARRRPSAGIPCRRNGEQPQSHSDRGAVPSRDRLRRHSVRLWRRARRQTQTAATGRSTKRHVGGVRLGDLRLQIF